MSKLYKAPDIHLIWQPFIGRTVASLPGALQNEFWRFKLAGWLHDRGGKVEFV